MAKKKVSKKKKDIPLLKKFRVLVCRIGYAHADIEVVARSKEEACRLAEDKAGSCSFSEHEAEYEAQGAIDVAEIDKVRKAHCQKNLAKWFSEA